MIGHIKALLFGTILYGILVLILNSTTIMKILVAYDGSDYAIEAVDDLLFAGLPDKCKAVVLSVTDDYYPLLAPGSSGIVAEYISLEEMDSDMVSKPLRESVINAKEGADLIQELFPSWQVSAETNIGAPATAILEKANEFKPNLIVIGSHGRTGLKKFFLGSVSLKVLSGAHSSVRLARKHDKKANPLKVLVGYDGSQDAEKVIKVLEHRNFPPDTTIKLVSALEIYYAPSLPYSAVAVEEALIESMTERERLFGENLTKVAQRLQLRYPNTDWDIIRGNAKHTLLDVATKWGADEIFVGARGMTNLERIFLGSVSSFVAGHAHCTVEVVR